MQFDQTYYETCYRDYRRQNPLRKLRFYRRLAEQAAVRIVAPRILDIGCAFGDFLSQLDARWQRYGVDASEHAIALARRRTPNAHFQVSSPGGFPLSGPFDVVTAFDVLEHIPALEETFSWIYANLEPGGGFVLVVPVYDGPTGPLVRFLDKDPSHVHRESRDFWLQSARERFDLLEWYGIFRYLLPGGPYIHAVTSLLRRYTPAIACLLRRRKK